MPDLKSRTFSWDAFPQPFLKALAGALSAQPLTEAPLEWLNGHAPRPTGEMMTRGEVRRIVEDYWLHDYPGALGIYERLADRGLGPGGRPRSQRGYVDYIRRCRNSRSLREILVETMRRFGHNAQEPEDPELVRSFARLDPRQQPQDPRRPHEHQKAAWKRLSEHLDQNSESFAGLLVMPTGSGKTYTAVSWLYREILNRGKTVLWLAHSDLLLEQAALTFYRLAFLADPEVVAPLRIRIVSGARCSVSQMDPGDHILLCSVQSLARNLGRVDPFLRDPGRFVVVDEAHHAPARSYRVLLDELKSRTCYGLLGLTATPTRTREDERGLLSELFGKQILHEVSLRMLIEQRFLSRPVPIHVKTGEAADANLSEQERKHLARFNELSESQLNRIAGFEHRNQLIVSHYLENREKYGKTLVFAINVSHAALLAQRFREAGVSADYLASYRPDSGNDPVPRDAPLERFRDPDGLEVLVNVLMVTEGVDVPQIQTVFLARPTISEILVRQMIGRALRGPQMGGSELAYLVSFEDHWAVFSEWEDPLRLVPELVDLQPEPDRAEREKKILQALPWEAIQEAVRIFRQRGVAVSADIFEAVPHGWFVLEREGDAGEERSLIHVYEHQKPCWDALLSAVPRTRSELEKLDIQGLFTEYFADCDVPLVSSVRVEELLLYLQDGGEWPEYHTYREREACDPYALARQIQKAKLDVTAMDLLIEESYNASALARAIYPSQRDFETAVSDARYELRKPDSATRRPKGIPVFGPAPDVPLRPGPCHDLKMLLAEAMERAAGLLQLQKAPGGPRIEWTGRLIKGWFGMAYPDGGVGNGRIRINCLLDSPDLSRATLLFLLWHEYLHLYLPPGEGHSKRFRQLERSWEGWQEADHELDSLNEKWTVSYW